MTRTLVATPDPEPRPQMPGFQPRFQPMGLVLTGNATTSSTTTFILTVNPPRSPRV